MKQRRALSLIPLLLPLFLPFARAEEDQAREPQQQRRQRDRVILELLERVEALERELGVAPGESRANGSSGGAQLPEPDKRADAEPAAGVVVVDEGLAERALERSLTRDGALLLPPGVFEIEPRLAYARQEDAVPSFVMSGGSLVASETERNSDRLSASILFRLGLCGDAQLELGLPYRWRRTETVTTVNATPVDTSTRSANSPGDVRVALAKTLWREAAHTPDVIARLSWDTDSGERSDEGVALGGGLHELRGALSFIKREDPVVFVGGLSYEYAFEEDATRAGDTLAADVGSYVALSPQTSLSFNLALAYQEETERAGSAVEGTDSKIATLLIGGSTFLGRRTLLNLSLGIGLTKDADDLSVSVSLPIRF